ncbi:MAG: hypothetical protein LBB80_03385 [Treponema sp.]|nr:hypothetical protein [Treponema sp.]
MHVSEPKTLEVISFIYIMIGEQYTAHYTVTPDNDDALIQASVAGGYNGIVVSHFPERNEIVFVGGEEPSDTLFTLSANEIEALISVRVTDQSEFRWVDKNSVRTTPGAAPTELFYEILPAKSAVTMYDVYGNGIENDPSVAAVVIDKDEQKVTVAPHKSGFRRLKLRSSRDNSEIVLDIYAYYETVNVNWVMDTNITWVTGSGGNAKKSRIDGLAKAIYIADDESIKLYANADKAEAGLTIPSAANNTNDSELGVSVRPLDGGSPGVAVWCQDWPGPGSSGKANDSLYESKYVGTIKIEYKYWNGGTVKATFYKMFMVYREKWRRKF